MVSQVLGVTLLLVLLDTATALGWRSQRSDSSHSSNIIQARTDYRSSQLYQTDRDPLTLYEIALDEMRQLESEPVCHRTAARLLINNCQVLDGKDEATILTDSGRQIRDFVDAYAASLAICDLERGSFTISPECYKFREPALKLLSTGETAFLHVSSQEIDRCLSGLASSDSGWNTWVSYRHKALRFCEAARADSEKDEHIRIFQRLTKTVSKMTDGVEEQLDERMNDLNSRTQMASERLDRLSPQMDRLSVGLSSLEDLISGSLAVALLRSSETIDASTNSAANLQRALEILMQTVLATNAEAASAHERSMEVMARETDIQLVTVMTAMNAAVASAISLQDQMELAHSQGAELEYRQAYLEKGLVRLINITEVLASRYDQHTHLLHEAQNMTTEILDTLEGTAASAAVIGDAFLERPSATSWWPYIWCPAASLVMGSYGLPPSAIRNVALVALGEAAGFIISSVQSRSFNLPSFTGLNLSFAKVAGAATLPTSTPTSNNAAI